MKQEGLVTSKRGLGNIVMDCYKPVKAHYFLGTVEDITLRGLPEESRGKLLDFSRSKVSRVITDYLHLREGTEVFLIEKVRIVQGNPFSYSLHYLPPKIGSRIDANVVQEMSVLQIVEDVLGLDASEATQILRAEIADARVASILGIRVGDPVLSANRVIFDPNHKPILYQSIYYPSEKYGLIIMLSKTKSKGHTIGKWKLNNVRQSKPDKPAVPARHDGNSRKAHLQRIGRSSRGNQDPDQYGASQTSSRSSSTRTGK